MANTPLMPKATAVWLVDNTALSFTQIAAFCRLHPLEVKAIADGEAAQGIKGLDPVLTGQLSREELEKAQADPNYQLKLQGSKVVVPESKRKGPRYTPVSRRQDRPNAILWLVRNHPELKDAQIIRLVGTTKPTIAAIRDRTHWNSSSLVPSDPVTLGLCSQLELDMEVEKAAKNAPQPIAGGPDDTLMPVEDTTSEDALAAAFSFGTSKPIQREEEEVLDAEAVFANLGMPKKASSEEEPADDVDVFAAGEEAETAAEAEAEAEADAEIEASEEADVEADADADAEAEVEIVDEAVADEDAKEK